MSAKPWAEMTDREKCEAMAAWASGTCIPCWADQCDSDCLLYFPEVEDCNDIAARLLKEGKV